MGRDRDHTSARLTLGIILEALRRLQQLDPVLCCPIVTTPKEVCHATYAAVPPRGTPRSWGAVLQADPTPGTARDAKYGYPTAPTEPTAEDR